MSELTPLAKQTRELQMQINRFVSPKLPVTGALDAATAVAALHIMLQRFSTSYAETPSEVQSQVTTLVASLVNPVNLLTGSSKARAWVASNLKYATDTIRDYGDFIGKPPASASTSWLIPLGAVAAVAAVYFFMRSR